MYKIIIPAILGILVLSIGLSPEVYGPIRVPILDDRSYGHFNAVDAKLNSANKIFPTAPSNCNEPVAADDTIIIACEEGEMRLSQKQLDRLNDLLADIQTEIEEIQMKQSDWEFILERAR